MSDWKKLHISTKDHASVAWFESILEGKLVKLLWENSMVHFCMILPGKEVQMLHKKTIVQLFNYRSGSFGFSGVIRIFRLIPEGNGKIECPSPNLEFLPNLRRKTNGTVETFTPLEVHPNIDATSSFSHVSTGRSSTASGAWYRGTPCQDAGRNGMWSFKLRPYHPWRKVFLE